MKKKPPAEKRGWEDSIAGQMADPKDPAADRPPFFCPDYSGAITDEEFEDLYAYLESLAPKRKKWKVR